MKGIILLNAHEDTRRVEEEEKSLFIKNVLGAVGLPIDNMWEEDGTLSSANHSKLRQTLASFNVAVLDNKGGDLQIFVDKEKIAQWDKPSYILKRDLTEIDPKKKLFLEMHTNYWTVFENNTNG